MNYNVSQEDADNFDAEAAADAAADRAISRAEDARDEVADYDPF